jgi:hypothetical protein
VAETYWPTPDGEQMAVCGFCDDDLADMQQR